MTGSIRNILTHAVQKVWLFSVNMHNARHVLNTLEEQNFAVYPVVGSWQGKMEVGYIVVDDHFLEHAFPYIKHLMMDQEAVMSLTRTGLIWQATVHNLPPITDKFAPGKWVGQFKELPSTQKPCCDGWTYCTTEGKYYVVD